MSMNTTAAPTAMLDAITYSRALRSSTWALVISSGLVIAASTTHRLLSGVGVIPAVFMALVTASAPLAVLVTAPALRPLIEWGRSRLAAWLTLGAVMIAAMSVVLAFDGLRGFLEMAEQGPVMSVVVAVGLSLFVVAAATATLLINAGMPLGGQGPANVSRAGESDE